MRKWKLVIPVLLAFAFGCQRSEEVPAPGAPQAAAPVVPPPPSPVSHLPPTAASASLAAPGVAPRSPTTATAASAALSGEQLFMQRTCFACHGPDAKTPILPEYPILAGQNEAYLLRQMRDIKAVKRTNGNTAAMLGVMHLVTDDELQSIAAYLSKLGR